MSSIKTAAHRAGHIPGVVWHLRGLLSEYGTRASEAVPWHVAVWELACARSLSVPAAARRLRTALYKGDAFALCNPDRFIRAEWDAFLAGRTIDRKPASACFDLSPRDWRQLDQLSAFYSREISPRQAKSSTP